MRAARWLGILAALVVTVGWPWSTAHAGGKTIKFKYDAQDRLKEKSLCTPTTSCAAQGKNCGVVDDGCGLQPCGTCSSGSVCTASNVCCQPTTCAAQGKNCGPVLDGCGGTLSCGTCPANYTCSANICVYSCTPETCEDRGASCGSFTSCGMTVSCGKCPTGSKCIGGSCESTTCFAAGTPITLADGSSKPIEEVAAGDAVLSYDQERGVLAEGRVRRTFEHPDTPGLLRINGALTTTPEHRFFVEGAWVRADDLQVGDRLLGPYPVFGADGAPAAFVTVWQLESLPGGVTTYNFEVALFHTYFAGGVLVHNEKIGP